MPFRLFFLLRQSISTRLTQEQEQWFLWAPVLLGLGISLYFYLGTEPSLYWCLSSVGAAILWFFMPSLFSKLGVASIFWISLGFNAGLVKTYRLKDHMLHTPQSLWIQGTVQRQDMAPFSPKGLYRYTLYLHPLQCAGDLKFLRCIRLKGYSRRALYPGQTLRVHATLRPFYGAVHPQGYDFRRAAFFQGISATGFTCMTPKILESSSSRPSFFMRYRHTLQESFYRALPHPSHALGSALITGDKSGLSPDQRHIYARAGLSHILAISGLHLALVSGFVYGIFQLLGLCFPYKIFYRIPTVMACISAWGYLQLSGQGIPAQRAFIMTTLATLALALHRQVLSLRTLALAALGVLCLYPESLVMPSFQMSFGAVLGLMTFPLTLTHKKGLVAFLGRGMISTFAASIPTLVISCVTFHTLSLVSILSNIVAIPWMGCIVMPLAFLVTVLCPAPSSFLWQGLHYGLYVFNHMATFFAHFPLTHIPWAQCHPWALPLTTLGFLWWALWRGSWRWWGSIPLGAGLICLMIPAQDFFIWQDPQGKITGIITPSTLWVNTKRRGRFTRHLWQEALGQRPLGFLPQTGGNPLGYCYQGHCRLNNPLPIVLTPTTLSVQGRPVPPGCHVTRKGKIVAPNHQRPWSWRYNNVL